MSGRPTLLLQEPYYLTTVNIKLNIKGKIESRDNHQFIASTNYGFFAFWNKKEPVFQNAQILPFENFQKIDYDENIHAYRTTLTSGMQLSIVFPDLTFIDIFNQLLSTKLQQSLPPNLYSEDYLRYILASLQENSQLERSHILETNVFDNTSGNLGPLINLPALKSFSFIANSTKNTIFHKRIWLGQVKLGKIAIDKSVMEITDSISKSSKPTGLLFVTSRQLIDFEVESPDKLPLIFNNSIDSLVLPIWMDVNNVYLFPTNESKKDPNNSQFPFHEILPLQSFKKSAKRTPINYRQTIRNQTFFRR